MAVPPGSRLILDFTAPLPPPDGGAVDLAFGQVAPPVGVGVGESAQFGTLTIRQPRPLRPEGWDAAQLPDWWSRRFTIERKRPRSIDPVGWAAGTVSAPTYVRWRRFLLPPSLPFSLDWAPPSRVRLAGGYQPAPGVNVTLNFAEPLVPPPGSSVVLEFGALGFTRVASATVGDTARFGSIAFGAPEQISPASLEDQASFGFPALEGTVRYVSLNLGIAPPAIDKPTLAKKAAPLLPAGMTPSLYGTAYVWNLRQYLKPGGIAPLIFGTPFLLGGVKFTLPGGIAGLAIGTAKVVNTTANQTAAPSGIPAIAMVAPSVSPRSLAPAGASSVLWGLPRVQKMPLLVGWASDVYGGPVIEFKTKHLLVGGFAYTEQGYPLVFDRTQRLQVSALLETGLFGDGRVFNKTRTLRGEGLDALAVSDWVYVVNTRRYVGTLGWSSQTAGASEIANKSPSLAPPGFDSLGAPSVYETGIGYRHRALNPNGLPFPSPALGTPVLTKTPELFPVGIAGAVGTPLIERWLRYLEANGSDTSKFGTTLNVWFGNRPVLINGFDEVRYGTQARIEHSRRTLLAQGANAAALGMAQAGNANRTVLPPGIPISYPSPPMVGGSRYLRPVGFEATLFGARIIPEIQAAYPQGFAGDYGQASLYNLRQTAAPKGFITVGQQPADRWGTSRVWNRLQFVALTYDPTSDLNVPAWPQWTLVENRNKTLRATGQDLGVVGLPQIDNNARLVAPVGATAPDPGEFYRAGMVAYRIRYFRMEGMEPPYLSGWATVYNEAFVAAPPGTLTEAFGNGEIINTRRYYDFIDGPDTAVFGYPMVADRIRYLDIESRYGIAPPYIQLPEVKLHTRYVDVIGNEMSRVGGTTLDIHWTIIAPKWTLQNLYGSPVVRNLTPELHQQGRNSEEFGAPYLRLQWRPLDVIGELTQWLGKPIVGYRDRPLFISGFRALAIGDKLVVTKTGAPPYSTQYIYLDRNILAGDDSGNLEGDGIPPPKMGTPIINQQVIYHRQEDKSEAFGETRVTANSIHINSGIWEIGIGEVMVSNWRRTIAPQEIEDKAALGKPRITPHTIYSVMEAPLQAKENHPRSGLHYVDGYGNRNPGITLGSPSVMNRHRVIRPVYIGEYNQAGNYMGGARYGRPDADMWLRYLAPKGLNALRVGWITIPGDVTVEQFNSANLMALGRPTVSRPIVIGPQTSKPTGFNAFAAGQTRIELFNRTLPLPGFLSMQMGTRKTGDTPYMWQGLRVGPLMPTIPAGFAAEALGKPWASYRVREVQVQGLDAFASEYQLEAFMGQLRVSRVVVPVPSRRVTPVGIAGFAANASDVKLNQHYIRPDGDAEQHRKGAF